MEEKGIHFRTQKRQGRRRSVMDAGATGYSIDGVSCLLLLFCRIRQRRADGGLPNGSVVGDSTVAVPYEMLIPKCPMFFNHFTNFTVQERLHKHTIETGK
ncbi:hypothetical protein NE237_010109 [Protea cynaroides]|uniref:Uncharacterized protein n=1 Tax=Protea cynaroides TaxID=273540 RepID=A0A9Q0KZU0_9MAGN|nr:hypothetical protein NE237_010109 [Protea cynaroides]